MTKTMFLFGDKTYIHMLNLVWVTICIVTHSSFTNLL